MFEGQIFLHFFLRRKQLQKTNHKTMVFNSKTIIVDDVAVVGLVTDYCPNEAFDVKPPSESDTSKTDTTGVDRLSFKKFRFRVPTFCS